MDFHETAMCIDIVKICFGTANGQILSIFELSAHDTSVVSFQDKNLCKFQWIFTKLDVCIDIGKIWFGLVLGKFRQFLTVISPRHDNVGILSFIVSVLILLIIMT